LIFSQRTIETEVSIMPRVRLLLVLGLFVAIAAIQDPSKALFAQSSADGKLEVLSPWVEVDPIPLRGISPRIDNLAGKKIGLFVNYKRAAQLGQAGSEIQRCCPYI
jgi:hypothetical protein